MMRKILNWLVRICIIIGMLAGAALLVLLCVHIYPIVANFFRCEGKAEAFTALSVIIGTLCVLGAEYIAALLLGMMRTLEGDPFVQKNVRALTHMGVTALLVAGLGLSTMLMHPTGFAVLAAFPLAMCGLFSLVLSGVFAQAVACKQENDLTV